jgi:hypothetical protein
MTTFDHAASGYSGEEMLLAFVAERLESLMWRMVRDKRSRVALFGGREHAAWLCDRIAAMGSLPIVAFVDRPDRWGERTDIGVPVLRIDDPRLPEIADVVLIADDRCEDVLKALATVYLPEGVLIWGLYERLGIGGEPLGVVEDGTTAANAADANPTDDAADAAGAGSEVEGKRTLGVVGSGEGYRERVGRLVG